jgi:Family of unknown function (DUF6263)
MKKLLALSLFFSGLLFIQSCGDKKENEDPKDATFSLAYKFKPGMEFYVLLDWSETVDGKDSLGQGKKDTIQMVTTFKYVVNNVDESGVADMSVTYDHLRMGNFDSDDTTQRNTREGMMFAGMMNYVLKAKIDSKGNVLELTGGDNFYTFGQPDSLVDDNACLRTDLAQFFQILPQTDVKKGASWEGSHKVNYGYPGSFKNKYTLTSVEDSIANIEITSEITPNGDGMTVFPGGFILRQLFTGTRTCAVKFDMKKGIITSSSYHDLYNGTATGTANGNRIKINLNVDLHKEFSVATN